MRVGQAGPVTIPASTLITRIGELVTNDGDGFAAMTDAALVIEDGAVAWTGPAGRAPAADSVVDAEGRAVLPGFATGQACPSGRGPGSLQRVTSRGRPHGAV